MYFRIKTSVLEVDITTEEKYTFISGFSGAGKSLLIEEIGRVINTSGSIENTIQSDLDYHLIGNKDNLDTMDFYISKDKPALFIADEFYANKVAEAIVGKNAYCLCVTRKIPRNINFSYRSLYRAYRDDMGITRTKSEIEMMPVDLLEMYDRIITEDKKAGYKYIIHLIDKIRIESAEGKSNLKDSIKRQHQDYNLLIFADAAGIGSEIKRILSECNRRRKRGSKVHLMLPECFEQILVESKMLENCEHSSFVVTDDNLESFYEKEIERLTKGTVLEYTHEKQDLSKCWLDNCAGCDKGCTYSVLGSKAKAVIGNGKCAGMLKFARKELL